MNQLSSLPDYLFRNHSFSLHRNNNEPTSQTIQEMPFHRHHIFLIAQHLPHHRVIILLLIFTCFTQVIITSSSSFLSRQEQLLFIIGIALTVLNECSYFRLPVSIDSSISSSQVSYCFPSLGFSVNSQEIKTTSPTLDSSDT